MAKKKSVQAKLVSLSSGLNTARVEFDFSYRHPKYEKLIKGTKEVLVDLPEEAKANYKLGSFIEIEQVRPVSKLKTWRLVQTKSEDKKE